MHPAFSVIFFTTASGAGYGLLFLLGLDRDHDSSAANLALLQETIVVAHHQMTL